MSYIPGKPAIQYRCTKCRVVSPEPGTCFVCKGPKQREIVPLIATKRNKMPQINIKVG